MFWFATPGGTTLVSDSYPNVLGLFKLACAFNLFLLNSSFEEDFLNPSARLAAMMCPRASVNPRGRTKIRSFPYVSKILLPSFYFIFCEFLCADSKKSSLLSNNKRNREARDVKFARKGILSVDASSCFCFCMFACVCYQAVNLCEEQFFCVARKFRYEKYEASKKEDILLCVLFFGQKARLFASTI